VCASRPTRRTRSIGLTISDDVHRPQIKMTCADTFRQIWAAITNVDNIAVTVDVAMVAGIVLLFLNMSSQLAVYDSVYCGWSDHRFEENQGYSIIWVMVQISLLVYVMGGQYLAKMRDREQGLSKLLHVAIFSTLAGFFLWATVVPRCGGYLTLTTEQNQKKSSVDETGKAIATLIILMGTLELIHILATRFGKHAESAYDVKVGTTYPTAIALALSLVGSIVCLTGMDDRWSLTGAKDASGAEIASIDLTLWKGDCDGDSSGAPEHLFDIDYAFSKSSMMAILIVNAIFAALALVCHAMLRLDITVEGYKNTKIFVALFEYGMILTTSVFLASLATATINPICVYAHHDLLHGSQSWGVCFVTVSYFMFIMAQNAAYYMGLEVNGVGSTLSGLRDHLMA